MGLEIHIRLCKPRDKTLHCKVKSSEPNMPKVMNGAVIKGPCTLYVVDTLILVVCTLKNVWVNITCQVKMFPWHLAISGEKISQLFWSTDCNIVKSISDQRVSCFINLKLRLMITKVNDKHACLSLSWLKHRGDLQVWMNFHTYYIQHKAY